MGAGTYVILASNAIENCVAYLLVLVGHETPLADTVCASAVRFARYVPYPGGEFWDIRLVSLCFVL